MEKKSPRMSFQQFLELTARYQVSRTLLAEMLGVTRHSVYFWIATGRIPARRRPDVLRKLAEVIEDRAEVVAEELDACRQDARRLRAELKELDR